jgi:hypothetical protein
MGCFNDANDLTWKLFYSEAYQDANVKYPPYRSLTLKCSDGVAEFTATVMAGNRTHDEWVKCASEVEALLQDGYYPDSFVREDGEIESLLNRNAVYDDGALDDIDDL